MNAFPLSEVRVYAAGSLRAPFSAMEAGLAKTSGQPIELTFGPSGLLRERIAQGEAADVFASANMAHPQALVTQGWSTSVVPFARNELCVLAAPGVALRTDNVLDVLLDPRWKVGTSTPNADPSGDCAWELFRRADALRPDAFATLTVKALRLVGGRFAPQPPSNRNVYATLVASGQADVFLTYCTNAMLAIAEEPSLAMVRLPEPLRVGAYYGLTVRRLALTWAGGFADYVISPEGQRTLAQFGFALP